MTFYKLNNYLREEFRRPLGGPIPNANLEEYLREAMISDASTVTVGDGRRNTSFQRGGGRPFKSSTPSRRGRNGPPLQADSTG